MKAISLHQPYASLIAYGIKTLETRSRAIHHRGEIAIHASKRFTSVERATWGRFHGGWRETFPCLSGDHSFPPLGVVVAVAEVTACIRSYEDAIVCGGKGDCDGPACVTGERFGRLVCARCGDADARGSFVCGTSFDDARSIVNAGDAARLALDAGDT